MNYNKYARNLTFRRGSEIGQGFGSRLLLGSTGNGFDIAAGFH